MKTIFGWKSLQAIENCEFIAERVINGVVLISGKGVSRDRRKLRRRSQPSRAAHHGDCVDCWDCSREAQKLQGSRNLPDDCSSLEFVDDRPSNVAIVPATGEAVDV